MKKFLAILLAAIMVLSMGVTAFAAPDEAPTDGSITIRNATIGKEYDVYKVFDLTYEEETVYDKDGNATSPVAYTYTDKTVPADTEAGTDAVPDAFLAALKADDSPFTLVETKVPGVYNVALKKTEVENEETGETEEKEATVNEIITFLKANKGNLEKKASVTADEDEEIVSNLPYGYYFVTSSLGAEVTIDSTLKDVTIYDKNEEPDIPDEPEPDPEDPNPDDPEHPSPYLSYPGKKIVNPDGTLTDTNSANYGDYVHFGYSLNATAYADPFDEYNTDDEAANEEQNKTGLVTYYYIEDVMNKGFNLVTAKATDAEGETVATAPVVRVITTDADGNKTIKALTEGTDYTIRYSENVGTADGEDEAFQITIPWGEKYGSNATITVDYYGLVTEEAIIAADGNPNTANFAYDTDPNFDPDDDPDDPKIPPTIPNPDYDPDEPESEDNPKEIPNPEYEEDPNPPYDPEDPTDPEYPEDPYEPENPTDPYDPDDEDNPPYNPDNEEKTQTFVYALGLVKTDEEGNEIATAHFTVEKKVLVSAAVEDDPETEENEAKDAVYEWVPVCVKTVTGDAAGVYRYNATGDPEAADCNEIITPDTGDNLGEIIVEGLEEGTYRFTETQAPKGYNLAADPFEVTIDDTGVEAEYTDTADSYTSAYTETVTANGKSYTLAKKVKGEVIENRQGQELPSTGGIGTRIFYIGGGILVLGAAILLITKKRMTNQ